VSYAVEVSLELGDLEEPGLTVSLEEVYFGKAKDVVGDLRSKFTFIHGESSIRC
jgi:hypothetical protein